MNTSKWLLTFGVGHMGENFSPTGQRIMDAALELFAENGYRSTTTRSIAGKAGVNELSIFRIFKTKEKLLEAVLDNRFDIRSINESFHGEWSGDPREDLLKMIGIVRVNLRKRRTFFQLMLREQGTNEVVRNRLGAFPLIIKKGITDGLRSILKGRVPDDFDHETAGLFLFSYFLRSEIMSAMIGEDPFHAIDDGRIEVVLDIFLNGILKEGEKI